MTYLITVKSEGFGLNIACNTQLELLQDLTDILSRYATDKNLIVEVKTVVKNNLRENVAGTPNAFDKLFNSLPEKDKLRM